MRKSPTIKPRVCDLCGETYTPSGPTQKFCSKCKLVKERETKLRYYRKKFPNAKPKKRCEDVCCICGNVFSAHFEGKAYCNLHYLRMKTNGSADLIKRQSKNQFIVDGSNVICQTTSGAKFLVSTSDLEEVKKYSWCVSKTGYLVANINGKVTKLHRYLLSPKSNEIVDHINGDPKDNRRENLRICNSTENSRNSRKKSKTSNFTGVQMRSNGKYRARIMVDGKEIALGVFETEAEAIVARKNAEEKYFGDYSPIASRKTSTLGSSE